MLIPKKRLGWIPKRLRLAHEYCFFLHDEFARMFVEYETAEAPKVSFKFATKTQAKRFENLVKQHDTISAMRELGLNAEARRVILNQITMAMVSDTAHHIYEALRCFEKRKFIPGFNLLRKPLLDSMMYLSWIVAEEDDFYAAFTSKDPSKLTQKLLGNRRKEILDGAITKAGLSGVVYAQDLISIIFDSKNPSGLYWLFQHAVHLVTVERIEIMTSPENFNFIFKDPNEDDIYETLYNVLPTALLFLTRVIFALFERIAPPTPGAKAAFEFRTVTGYLALQDGSADEVARLLGEVLSPNFKCKSCSAPINVTRYNAMRLLLTESFRCTGCRQNEYFPLSRIF